MSDDTPNDQVHKLLSDAMAEAAQDLICDAVEEALDTAYKAHRNDFREALGLPERVADAADFREWLEPVRVQAAADLKLSPTVAAFIARYLA
ncbi:hypothetical protein [Streptomyces sp. NPDC005143]